MRFSYITVIYHVLLNHLRIYSSNLLISTDRFTLFKGGQRAQDEFRGVPQTLSSSRYHPPVARGVLFCYFAVTVLFLSLFRSENV